MHGCIAACNDLFFHPPHTVVRAIIPLKSVMFYTENKLTINRLMLSVYITKKSVLVYMMIKFSSIHAFKHTCTDQLSFPGSSPYKMIQACTLLFIIYSYFS